MVHHLDTGTSISNVADIVAIPLIDRTVTGIDTVRNVGSWSAPLRNVKSQPEATMLRITVNTDPERPAIKLEGKLAGPWVDELLQTWNVVASNYSPKKILVDLSNVTFIDAEGKRLLWRICGEGSSFKTRGCVATYVVQEIKRECERL